MPYVWTWAVNIESYCISNDHYDGKPGKLKEAADALHCYLCDWNFWRGLGAEATRKISLLAKDRVAIPGKINPNSAVAKITRRF